MRIGVKAAQKAAAAAALAMLAACASKPPPAQPKPASAVSEDLPPRPREKPEIRPRARQTRPPASANAPQAAGPNIELSGLSRPEIEALLGEPAERTEQAAGQSWVYRGPRCRVEIALFFDVNRNEFYALDQRTDGAVQNCLQQIAAGRQVK